MTCMMSMVCPTSNDYTLKMTKLSLALMMEMKNNVTLRLHSIITIMIIKHDNQT